MAEIAELAKAMMLAMAEQQKSAAQQNKVLLEQKKLMDEQSKRLVDQNQMILDLLQVQANAGQSSGVKGPSIDHLEKQLKVFEYEPESGVTFEAWYARYEHIFETELDECDDSVKVNVLLRHLSNRVHAQYSNFITPAKPHEESFEDTLKVMKQLFGEKKTLFEKQLDFFSCRMSKLNIEDIKSFASRVNKTVEEAQVKEMTVEQLKVMVFMTGIDLPRYADMLMSVMEAVRKAEDIQLPKVLELCDQFASLMKDSQAVLRDGNAFAVNAVAHGKSSRWKERENSKKGNYAHKEVQCFGCGKYGHIKRNCVAKRFHRRRRSTSSSSSTKEDAKVSSVMCGAVEVDMCDVQDDAFTRTATVNGNDVQFQVDTGSDSTFMSSAAWKVIGSPEIAPVNINVMCADGKNLEVRGQCAVALEMNGIRASGNVYVTEKGRVNLLGKDFFASFFKPLEASSGVNEDLPRESMDPPLKFHEGKDGMRRRSSENGTKLTNRDLEKYRGVECVPPKIHHLWIGQKRSEEDTHRWNRRKKKAKKGQYDEKLHEKEQNVQSPIEGSMGRRCMKGSCKVKPINDVTELSNNGFDLKYVSQKNMSDYDRWKAKVMANDAKTEQEGRRRCSREREEDAAIHVRAQGPRVNVDFSAAVDGKDYDYSEAGDDNDTATRSHDDDESGHPHDGPYPEPDPPSRTKGLDKAA